MRFLKRKRQKGNKSDRCFVCEKKGHYAKDCHKQKKRQQMMAQLQSILQEEEYSDIESIFDRDDFPSQDTIMAIQY